MRTWNAVSVLVVALWMTGCWVGNGERLIETRTVDEFTKVQVTQGVVLSAQVGEPTSLSIEADSNLMPVITSNVEAGTLHIGVAEGVWVSSAQPIRATLVAPVLEGVEATSNASVRVEGASAPEFSVVATSGAVVEVVGLQAEWLRANTTSEARLVVEGEVSKVEAESTSGSVLTLADLRARSVRLDATTKSKGVVVATEEVTGSVDTLASILVRGSPARKSLTVTTGGTVHYEE